MIRVMRNRSSVSSSMRRRRRSRYRYSSRSDSSTSAPDVTSNGSGADGARMSIAAAATSIWPVARPGFAVPLGRARTSPRAATTNSLRTEDAISCASELVARLTTTWVMP